MGWALKNKAKDTGNLRYAQTPRILAFHPHASMGWLQQTDRVLDQCGFACAIRTQHRDQITAPNFKIDILQDVRSLIAITEVNVLKDDQRLAASDTGSWFS